VKLTYKRWLHFLLAGGSAVCFLVVAFHAYGDDDQNQELVAENAQNLVEIGRETFRFDTFGDEAFWGGWMPPLFRNRWSRCAARQRLSGRPLAGRSVSYRAARGAALTSEGRFLPRRAVRDPI